MTDHPLERITLSGFGAFAEVDLPIAARLNVVVGDNATGKSHLLSLAYAATAALHRDDLTSPAPRAKNLGAALAEQLMTTMRPSSLGRLVHRGHGQVRADLEVSWSGLDQSLAASFSPTARTRLAVSTAPARRLEATAVLTGPHALAFAHPTLTGAGEQRARRDLHPGAGPRHAARDEPGRQATAPILAVIEAALRASVIEREGRLYLRRDGIGDLEMPLVGQGQDALATIACLIGAGVLVGGGYLLWDTPEAGPGPALLTTAAAVIAAAARAGVQVFIATHSLFLLRELDIALVGPEGADLAAAAGYIDLRHDRDGVRARVGATSDEVGEIAALDAELTQTTRYLAADVP